MALSRDHLGVTVAVVVPAAMYPARPPGRRRGYADPTGEHGEAEQGDRRQGDERGQASGVLPAVR